MYLALMVLFDQNDHSPSANPKEIREISKKKNENFVKIFLKARKYVDSELTIVTIKVRLSSVNVVRDHRHRHDSDILVLTFRPH